MIKYYCDICDEQITEFNEVNNDPRLLVEITNKNGQDFEATIVISGINNINRDKEHRMICKYCVLDAIQKLDDRSNECRTIN